MSPGAARYPCRHRRAVRARWHRSRLDRERTANGGPYQVAAHVHADVRPDRTTAVGHGLLRRLAPVPSLLPHAGRSARPAELVSPGWHREATAFPPLMHRQDVGDLKSSASPSKVGCPQVDARPRLGARQPIADRRGQCKWRQHAPLRRVFTAAALVRPVCISSTSSSAPVIPLNGAAGGPGRRRGRHRASALCVGRLHRHCRPPRIGRPAAVTPVPHG
jgi:hypothetical protein